MTQHPTYDLVVGLGRSGMSMARFLKSLGRTVIATDINPSTAPQAEALEALGIRTQIGFHDQAVFDRADRIIPSPGIPLNLPVISKARARGVAVCGELDLFGQHNTTPVIAVTGSNGKTTTTRLIEHMAESCGFSCFVGGNIGTPLVDYLMGEARTDLVVAEVSSFQLDLAARFRPGIGVLLNITPDHLDRYPDYKAYQTSKWSLLTRQDKGDTAIVNAGITGAGPHLTQLTSNVIQFLPQPGTAQGDLVISFNGRDHTIGQACFKQLTGGHNRENIIAASLAVMAAGGRLNGICKGLEHFAPLPHRTEFISQINGIRFYNDSKATNTDAVIRALQGFDTPVILILGGREKDTDFTELIPALSGVRAIMAIGEATGHIMDTLNSTCPVTACKDMAQAVIKGFDTAAPGDVVLLSPACASFDMYDNYKTRGLEFTGQVKALETEAAHG